MPGRRLSQNEKQLLGRWVAAGNDANPILRTIEIAGGTGLRGIDGLAIHFRYPITAICGPNGVGKSTVLALAALAFRAPAGWRVHRGHDQPHSKAASSHYIFQDFFVQAPGDQAVSGVTITWRYRKDGQEISRSVTKTPDRWGRYRDRPGRAVHFVPLGRLAPAYEVGAMRTVFTAANAANAQTLSAATRADLSYIMGRQYDSADVQRERRWMLQRCRTNASYSAFNMGAGESCMISILHLLEGLPNGGLLVVEEIEAGLHPQAQARLAQRLVEICLNRGVQIICTSHSAPFLDALPRQARLLLLRRGDEHTVVESPSTRWAMAEMSGELQPELVIYCEDETAATLIAESLPATVKPRVSISVIGSKASVIRQGVAHRRAGFAGACLCVLDGDVTVAEVDRWLNTERGQTHGIDPAWLILPGQGANPERWIVDQLRHPDYESAFAGAIGFSIQNARGLVELASVNLDSRALGYTIHQRTGLQPADGVRRAMQSCALQHPLLGELRTRVSTLLA